MAEAQFQKLKVAELKDLLQKHELPLTGKKDDLVKRLLENNIAAETAQEEELIDPDAEANGEATKTDAGAGAPVPAAVSEQQPAATTTQPATTEGAASTEQTLTPEQQAMKARAERFGIPFNPNATSTTRTKPAAPASTASEAAAQPAAASTMAKKEKPGAIDKAPLGISDEVLAKRAAKFGLPEKKETPAAPVKEKAAPASKPAAAAKPEAELTPEMKEKLAAEEEKKRKRAEKFGLAKPANGAESEGSDAKKAKV